MLKLSQEERECLEKISAISGSDIETVKDILLSFWVYVALELYQGNKDINIPYLFQVHFDFRKNLVRKGDGIKELHKITTNPALSNTLLNLAKGQKSNLEEILKGELKALINDVLEH